MKAGFLIPGRLARVLALAAIVAAGSASAETLVWTGAASSDWNLTDLNWTNEQGEATAWVNGSSATFTECGSAALTISVTDDIQLHNLMMTRTSPAVTWNDGGGSLTFVSDEANPTNYITISQDGLHAEMNARVNSARPLVKDGGGVIRLYNGVNNLTGGVVVAKSQLRFGPSGSIGPCTVTVLGNSTLFSDATSAPDVKYVESDQAFMGSTGYMLTIKSVGVTADNVSRKFGIGRSNDNSCKITLALTDPESEGIGQYVVRGGGMDLTFDGGTVKASPKTSDVFFNATENMTPVARVTNNGVTFDTAGANTELGLKLAFDGPKAITNVVETVEPENWSFETGSFSPWSVNAGGVNETSAVQNNTSAFMNDSAGNHVEAFCTTNGSRFAVLRRYGSITQTVSLPTAGLWRVSYERGCRPHTGYPAQALSLTVSLGGDANATVSPAQPSVAAYPFRRETTDLFELEAGSHVLKFTSGPHDKANYAVLLDAIRLERCELAPVPMGPLVKTGVGSLAVTNLVTDGLVAVSNGTLTVRQTTLDGARVEVAAGGTLELYATKLTNATVNVASGGTLRLRDGDGKNFVANGSFEDNLFPGVGYQAYAQNGGPRGWKMNYDVSSDIPGIQVNGSAMSNKGPDTDYGCTTAYLRQQARLQQTVTVPADGTYEVSFMHACRFGYNSYTIPLTCLIDGAAVASNGTRTANYGFERSTTRVNLTAGEHTLMFSTGSSSVLYAAIFIDDVRLMSVEGTNTLDGNALAFASGATLDLQNAEQVYIGGGVTVDGRAVKGNANALRRAGLTVTGTGSIQIGPPQGTTVLFR
ncbi:MAG: hypothetical protein IJL17_07610 [Kiritimatiellae bacterium]|nr:hypothetical protein [Kiritimatiellia bacterium]